MVALWKGTFEIVLGVHQILRKTQVSQECNTRKRTVTQFVGLCGVVPEQTLQYSVILSFRLADQHAAGQGLETSSSEKKARASCVTSRLKVAQVLDYHAS